MDLSRSQDLGGPPPPGASSTTTTNSEPNPLPWGLGARGLCRGLLTGPQKRGGSFATENLFMASPTKH